MSSDESHFNVSVGSDGQSHKTVSTNHNLFEEKGEPQRIRTEVSLLTSLTPYRWAKPADMCDSTKCKCGPVGPWCKCGPVGPWCKCFHWQATCARSTKPPCNTSTSVQHRVAVPRGRPVLLRCLPTDSSKRLGRDVTVSE